MTETNRKDAWEESYGRSENHVFYPSNEVVRFVARFLRRRVGLDKIVDVVDGAKGAKVLDLGCGIGRNLVFGTEMGLEMYGSDLSETAVAIARTWLSRQIGTAADDRVVAVDGIRVPWADGFFDHAISESVLDSMPFETARTVTTEIARLVRSGGYFYLDLISGDQTGKDADFDGEEIVTTRHEQDTIQSYFNRTKIDRLLGAEFEIVSCALHSIDDGKFRHGRWHVVARRV